MTLEQLMAETQSELRKRGWRLVDVERRKTDQISWWEHPTGKQFPQHYVVWLERSGAVRLL